jgi:hypothetical protein
MLYVLIGWELKKNCPQIVPRTHKVHLNAKQNSTQIRRLSTGGHLLCLTFVVIGVCINSIYIFRFVNKVRKHRVSSVLWIWIWHSYYAFKKSKFFHTWVRSVIVNRRRLKRGSGNNGQFPRTLGSWNQKFSRNIKKNGNFCISCKWKIDFSYTERLQYLYFKVVHPPLCCKYIIGDKALLSSIIQYLVLWNWMAGYLPCSQRPAEHVARTEFI